MLYTNWTLEFKYVSTYLCLFLATEENVLRTNFSLNSTGRVLELKALTCRGLVRALPFIRYISTGLRVVYIYPRIMMSIVVFLEMDSNEAKNQMK